MILNSDELQLETMGILFTFDFAFDRSKKRSWRKFNNDQPSMDGNCWPDHFISARLK